MNKVSKEIDLKEEITTKEKQPAKEKKPKNKQKKKSKIYPLTIICIIMDLLAIAGFVITYGPWDYLRNIYVTTAMKTKDHQYLANVFYSDIKVQEIMNKNYFIEFNENVNMDDIIIDTSEKDSYDNKYDEAILTRDEGNDLYKILNIKVGSSDAYIVAIYHPEKVKIISKQVLGTEHGERVFTMCNRYGGVVCINGGGFVDYGWGSGIPMGYVIENSTIRWSDGDSKTTRGNIIGMTDEGKLMLMPNATGQEALEAGITSGMEFGPFLIVNGKALEIYGDPWGKAPRVAIAQRKDGVILFLVVDGRNYINGASLQEMIDTLLKYGAYNAANLDGGQSATLVVNGKLYNKPPAEARSTNGRYVITGWGLIP